MFERLWRLIRANINSLVSGAEDPEKVLEQTILDMQNDLIQIRQAVATAIATQKRTERQYQQQDLTAQEWYRRAQLALQKGQEDLAREALIRRKTYEQTGETIKAQLKQQVQIINQLKSNMRLLEDKLAEAKAKKNLFIARARSAEATQRLNEVLGNLKTGRSTDVFEKMEEKVLQIEAKSQAIAELGNNPTDQQWQSLQLGTDIDTELEAMKAKMLSDRIKEQKDNLEN
ncbi:MAG: PspA/IM30 family protein [Microcoleaceae cyanobacterium]